MRRATRRTCWTRSSRVDPACGRSLPALRTCQRVSRVSAAHPGLGAVRSARLAQEPRHRHADPTSAARIPRRHRRSRASPRSRAALRLRRVAQVGSAPARSRRLHDLQQAMQRGQVQRAEAARVVGVERDVFVEQAFAGRRARTSSSHAVPGSARAPSSSSSGVTPPAAGWSASAPASSSVSSSATRRERSRAVNPYMRRAMQRAPGPARRRRGHRHRR